MKRKSKIQIIEVLSEYSQEMLATSGYPSGVCRFGRTILKV